MPNGSSVISNLDAEICTMMINSTDLAEEESWLIHAANYVYTDESDAVIHWASYHAQQQRTRCT